MIITKKKCVNNMLTFLWFVLIAFFSQNIYSNPDDFNRYFVQAARKAKPSVVNIHIYEKKPRRNETPVAYASGTIITRSGYIITNYHVITKGKFYKIIFNDGTSYGLKKFKNNKFFLADPKTDIALIRIDNHDDRKLVAIVFDDSNKLSEGEWVMAIGNPFGLKQSITSGIVSSKGRQNIGFADIEDFIQTDVPINPGNSGGPLINLYGRMVGLNTAIRTESGGYQGISFAIPSNIVKQVYYELRKYGRVRRGWIGFIARERRGHVQVLSVLKDSPAEHAQIKAGDYIRGIDNKPVHTLGSLVSVIGNKPVGSRINITISRNGRLVRLKLVLREKNDYKKIRFGLSRLFRYYGIEIDKNAKNNDVVISYVSPRRSFYHSLKTGDIIFSLNKRKVHSIMDFLKIFKRFGYKIYRLRIYRNHRIHTIRLK